MPEDATRREFMKGLAAAGGAGLLGMSSSSPKQLLQDSDSKEYSHEGEEALMEFERSLEEAGSVNSDVVSIEPESDEIVYTIGVEDKHIDTDFYAAALTNYDDKLVHEGPVEGTLKDIALWTNTAGDYLIREDDLPKENVTVYAGLTGRNNSFLPMKLDFERDNEPNIGEKAENALQELQDQAGKLDGELIPWQNEALHYLHGFDSAYEEQNKVVITDNLDGVDNDYFEHGEFELAGEHGKLANIQTDNNRTEAWIDTDYDELQKTEVGDRFNIGNYELELSHADPEAGYIEAKVVEGDYTEIGNAPFPQLTDSF